MKTNFYRYRQCHDEDHHPLMQIITLLGVCTCVCVRACVCVCVCVVVQLGHTLWLMYSTHG